MVTMAHPRRSAMTAALLLLLLPAVLGAQPIEEPRNSAQAAETEAADRRRPLDPVTRAKAMSALVGILALGLFLIALVIVGGYFARRRARLARGGSRYGHPELRVRPRQLEHGGEVERGRG